MGGTPLLLLFGRLSGGLRGGALRAVLHDTMAVNGALFARSSPPRPSPWCSTPSAPTASLISGRPWCRVVRREPPSTCWWCCAVGFRARCLRDHARDCAHRHAASADARPKPAWISVLALLALLASFPVPPTGYAVTMT